jgi:broad specificity phosphatase PhoE
LLAGSGDQNKSVEIIVDPQVTEINYGEDDGVGEELVKEKKKKFFAEYPEKNGDFDFAFPGAESFAAAGKRMKNALLEIAKKYPGKKILVVCHSGSMRALHLTGHISDPNSKVAIGQDLKFGQIMLLVSDGEGLEVII